MSLSRVIILVCDSLGVGELPDAADFGDAGSNTLGHLSEAVGGITVPNLEKLGIGKLTRVAGVRVDLPAIGAYGKMRERSAGKDTTTGHWEMMGLVSRKPFPTYPEGFPGEIIKPFEEAIGKKILGNKAASGTEIIKELGEQHFNTGRPIVYTSADSVFQIACHEGVVPLDKLYAWCRAARNILVGEHAVGRVIARPFGGKPGEFKRTENRRDFSVNPAGPTLLDLAAKAGHRVVGIGKIEDIFSGQGITESYHTGNNLDSINKTIELVEAEGKRGIIFTNLVDFDMLYGHRNDPAGYARALEVFDEKLGYLLNVMPDDDLLLITGDHGCDPTDISTDHTREYTPILAYSPSLQRDVPLGTRETFADLGATCAEALGIPYSLTGKSFYGEMVSATRV